MTWQHNTSVVCWSSGSNTPGNDAAPLNFRLLWGTRLSHWHLILLALLVIKIFLVSLLLLVSKVCTLGNYFCGWNARQKNILKELSDVVLESTRRRQCYTTFSSYGKFSVQFSSVAQSCQGSLWPMDSSMPDFPVHYQLPELVQTHFHQVSDAIQPSHHLIPFSPCLQSFPTSGSFPMSQFFSSGGQSIGTSPSASVLSMNIQEWFPFGLTGLIYLHSKGLSKVFSNITVQKYQFFSAQLSLRSNYHIHTWLLEKPQLWLEGPLLAK